MNATGGTSGSNQYNRRGTSQAHQQGALALVIPHQPPLLKQLQVVPSLAVAGRSPVWYEAAHFTGEWPGSRDAARVAAGHNWEPVLEDAYAMSTGPDGFSAVPIPGSKAVRRSDTGEVLGVNNTTRETISINDMYDLVEALVEQTGIWVMARMEPPARVNGDPSRCYHRLTMVNRIVGPGACSLEWTAVREESQASLSISELTGCPPLRYQLRHTKGWRQRTKDIEEAVMGVRSHTGEWQQQADYLASKKTTEDQRRAFVAEFIPMPAEGVISDQVKANVANDRGTLNRILESRTCEGVNGTGWGLVLAAAEFLDHERFYRNAESHFKRSLLRPEPAKRKAVQIVQRIVG